MGIHGFNKFLRDRWPHLFHTGDLSFFAGKRVAFDIYGWMYANKSVINGKALAGTNIMVEDPNPAVTLKNWLIQAINYIFRFVRLGIVLIPIFDGPNKPKAKSVTWDKRNKQLTKATDEIKELREKLRNGSIEEIGEDPQQKLMELMKKLKNRVSLSAEEPDVMMSVFRMLGIPAIQADGEAEKLCATLAIEGHVEAVHSADSDTIVFGCPVYIKEVDGTKCTVMYHTEILQTLKLNYTELIDFAIVCGCDYNTGVKGIGPVKAFDAITQVRSIDNFADPRIDAIKGFRAALNKDTEGLNHLECRYNFAFRPVPAECPEWADLVENGKNPVDLLKYERKPASQVEEVLRQYDIINCYATMDNIYALVENIKVIPSECRMPVPLPLRIVCENESEAV
jgi:flap endonuclease-1